MKIDLTVTDEEDVVLLSFRTDIPADTERLNVDVGADGISIGETSTMLKSE